MNTLKTLLIASLCFAFVACQQSSPGINATIKGAENMTVYFDQMGLNNTAQPISQMQADANGSFTFEMPAEVEPGLYRLRVGARACELILDGSENNVTIDGNLETLQSYDYTVTGSNTTNDYVGAFKKFASKQMNLAQLTEYIQNDASPLAAIQLAMKVFKARTSSLTVHEKVLEKVNNSSLVGSSVATQYGSIVSQLVSQKKREQAMNKIKVGQQAPEIALKNPEGEVVKLSDLKGQVVLIDFWASWCGPCRKANPKVVQVYDKYNPKGFTVFSVSLDGMDARTKKRYGGDATKIKNQMDRSKERWLGAIKKDNLKWDHHVSDLKKWDSAAAAEYGVRSIPQTFLVDRDGKIAAVNPKFNLEQEVQKVI